MAAEPGLENQDVRSLAYVLLFGTLQSRQRIAEELRDGSRAGDWNLLAEAARAATDWRLRARSLEMLGMIAGNADRRTAEQILAAVGLRN
jgi:hypothetical protein